jgi:propionyl-CoA synthetase
MKAGVTKSPDDISKELVQMVRDKIGAVACFKQVTNVARLPKTRSGKILRGTMRSIANGKEFRVPSTIDDPVIIDEITETLQGMGFPKA